MFLFQRYYEGKETVVCETPFTKWGTIYLLLFCFVMPVCVNGFCHTSIAIVLGKSVKPKSQLRDKLVVCPSSNGYIVYKSYNNESHLIQNV